jgi:hypothetical protein
VSALRSPVFPRAPERDRITAEPQVEDYVEFQRTGASAKGWFSCVDCGFGLASVNRLPSCANCGGHLWERAETSPFGLRPPGSSLRADLRSAAGAVRGAFLAFMLGFTLWLGIAGLAFGLFTLIDG